MNQWWLILYVCKESLTASPLPLFLDPHLLELCSQFGQGGARVERSGHDHVGVVDGEHGGAAKQIRDEIEIERVGCVLASRFSPY
jgi:hypothetical protein